MNPFISSGLGHGLRRSIEQVARPVILMRSDGAQNPPSAWQILGILTPLSTTQPTLSDTTMAQVEDFSPPSEFDDFRLIRSLGQGAMGQVFLCHDTQLDRPVAVKFVRSLYADEEARKRFYTEAKAIARLNHQNVVGVYRMGTCQGHPYIASQFIAGTSLERTPKPMPWQQALKIGLGLARGLAAAHRQKVLHRDIKPANIMLGEDGEAKLLDFGLAKLIDSAPRLHVGSTDTALPQDLALAKTMSSSELLTRLEQEDAPDTKSLTQTGEIMGTPLYMSPEAWHGEKPTPASDVYSLGVVLYELCTGSPPHLRETLTSLRHLVITTDARPLLITASQVDRRFAAIVDRCLRRLPTERFPSGEELHAALEELGAEAAATGALMAVLRKPQVQSTILGIVSASLLVVTAVWTYPKLRYRGQMATIAGGSFRMGSTPSEVEAAFDWCKLEPQDGCHREHFERELPQRTVTISSFQLDRREVTNEQLVQWLNRQRDIEIREGKFVFREGLMLANIYPTIQPSHGIEYDEASKQFRVLAGYERKPVSQVTWHGARLYCESLRKRLPTEAEWEFAARGPDGRRFPWGNDEPRCNEVAVAQGTGQLCARADKLLGTSDVGTSLQDRTPDGVFDLSGNVAEWVSDQFLPKYESCAASCMDPVALPKATDATVLRVIRGGAIDLGPVTTRATARSRWQQDEGLQDTGFRCAQSM